MMPLPINATDCIREVALLTDRQRELVEHQRAVADRQRELVNHQRAVVDRQRAVGKCLNKLLTETPHVSEIKECSCSNYQQNTSYQPTYNRFRQEALRPKV